MATSPTPTRDTGDAARTGLVGAVVIGIGFFDGVFLGAPIALLAAALEPSVVYAYIGATAAVVFLVSFCCTWLDGRWDVWLAGNNRIEERLDSMRTSRLMRRPVEWIHSGSDRRYALAAAVANPILVAAFARSLSGKPIGERRILLGAVAYAIPYVAIWTIVGFALGATVHAV
jgi:hypothetical protein